MIKAMIAITERMASIRNVDDTPGKWPIGARDFSAGIRKGFG